MRLFKNDILKPNQNQHGIETCFILGGPGARIRRCCGSLKVTVLLLCLVTNCCVISDSSRSLARFEVLTAMLFKSSGM